MPNGEELRRRSGNCTERRLALSEPAKDFGNVIFLGDLQLFPLKKRSSISLA